MKTFPEVHRRLRLEHKDKSRGQPKDRIASDEKWEEPPVVGVGVVGPEQNTVATKEIVVGAEETPVVAVGEAPAVGVAVPEAAARIAAEVSEAAVQRTAVSVLARWIVF